MEVGSLVMVDGYPWVGGTSPEGSGTSMEGSYHPREVGSTHRGGSVRPTARS